MDHNTKYNGQETECKGTAPEAALPALTNWYAADAHLGAVSTNITVYTTITITTTTFTSVHIVHAVCAPGTYFDTTAEQTTYT